MQDVGLMEEGKLYVTAESALFNQENNSFLEARILLYGPVDFYQHLLGQTCHMTTGSFQGNL